MQVIAYLIDMHFMTTQALQLNKTKGITDLIITLKKSQHIKHLWKKVSYFLGLSGEVRAIIQISHLWKKISHFKITRNNTWNRKRASQKYQLVLGHQKWQHPSHRSQTNPTDWSLAQRADCELGAGAEARTQGSPGLEQHKHKLLHCTETVG